MSTETYYGIHQPQLECIQCIHTEDTHSTYIFNLGMVHIFQPFSKHAKSRLGGGITCTL